MKKANFQKLDERMDVGLTQHMRASPMEQYDNSTLPINHVSTWSMHCLIAYIVNGFYRSNDKFAQLQFNTELNFRSKKKKKEKTTTKINY